MFSSFIPPRQVTIGDAASFAGTTPRAIRHYHELGLLPEPDRGSDGRHRYGYDEVIRLLWIRTMVDAGIVLDDIRAALASAEPASRARLLSDVVASRLEDLPPGSLRQTDLDSLLVTERIFGSLGAAVQATRFIALATYPGLREESDRVDVAEEALDDTVAVDDPRVAQVAAERRAFEQKLEAVIEESGLAQHDEELFDSWEALQPAAAAGAAEAGEDEDLHDSDSGQRSMSAVEAFGKMPYDFSPARLRSIELAEKLAAGEPQP